jgi:hypothetical protein
MPPHPDEAFGSPHNEVPGGDRKRGQKGKVQGRSMSDDVNVQRLREAMRWSNQQLKPFREQHQEAVFFYAGDRYGDKHGLDKTPVNLLKLAVGVWLRQLAAQTPRTLVLTRDPAAKTDAFELEVATDFLLKEIRFGHNLSEVVMGALFSMGVMKVGITEAYLAESSALAGAAGQPYADPVLFEDWIHDMAARRMQEWEWCANRYKLPYDAVMDNPEFKNKDGLMPRQGRADSGEGLDDPSLRTNVLSDSQSMDSADFRDYVELYDIWVPGDKLLVTLPVQEGRLPLQVREWEGPKNGPFHVLGFNNVLGNVIPTSPAQSVYDLQDVFTRIFNNVARQALRQKTLTLADGRAVADGTAEKIMEASDGQVIRTEHIDSVREMKYGGVDASNHGFLVWLRETFSYMAGNIEVMGGLASQAGTLGQEQLLAQSSSEMVRDMQAKVIDFTKDIITDLSWYLYSDPYIRLPLTKPVEGYGDIAFEWGPEARTLDFFNYTFDVEPYSLQHKGPTQRMQMLMQLATQIFIPMAPLMEQWGMQFNFQKFVEMLSKYGDLPEISELISSELPTPHEEMYVPRHENEQAHPNEARQSPVTQRNYTRSNIPTGGTQQARDAKTIQTLMKGGGGQ